MLRDGESRKVSVIVPAYNAERFVKRCVESLLCQTYQNMEVILVDDGSADHTGEIFDGYYKRYRSLIKVEHSVHGGVSNARLLGLKKAAGAYIAFVDADDWVEPEFLSSMVSHMSEADIVAAGISQETEEQKKVICEYNGLLSGRYASDWERAALYEKMLYCDEPYQFGVLPYMCNKLFKKREIQSLLEYADKRVFDGEDVLVLYPYLLRSQEIVLTDDCHYHYVMHSDSASLKDTREAYLNVSCLYQALYECFAKSVYQDALLAQLDQYMRRMIWKKNPAAYLSVNSFSFPYGKVKGGTRILLYGRGKIGNVFYRQLRQTGYCDIVAWADQDPKCLPNIKESVPQILPNQIPEYSFDYAVIAIGNREIADMVAGKLVSLGIDEKKVVKPD